MQIKKVILVLLFGLLTFLTNGQTYKQINSDTSITGVWDLQGKVLKLNSKILSGTIRNAIIEANPYVQVFDTSVILQNCKAREFSTAWYGADEKLNDNWVYLQKTIDVCNINKIKNKLIMQTDGKRYIWLDKISCRIRGRKTYSSYIYSDNYSVIQCLY